MRFKLQIPITISLISIYAATSMAVAPLGPSRALLGEGEKGIGISLSHQSMNLSASGDYTEQQPGGAATGQAEVDFSIKDLVSDPVFATLNYGINQDWDVFVRIGVVNAKDDVEVERNNPVAATRFLNAGNDASLNSGHEFAWGIGSRATFYEDDNISWGGSFHMTWMDPKASSDTITGLTGETGRVDLDLKYWEIVVAGGPTINLGDYWIYGGPILHFVRGDLDIDGTWTDTGIGPFPMESSSDDVEEESIIGGHIGAQWNQTEDLCWNAEVSFTGDAWGIGISGLWRVN
jgi:hypothetical protein